jgi:MerR family transcriptional regulator, copper efflux regulator
MNISEVAKLTGLTAKSIRLYEEKGLIQISMRGENGYRIYSHQHLDNLQLIARVKRVGFSLEECKSLVMLVDDPERKSQVVRDKAQEKLIQMTKKLKELG